MKKRRLKSWVKLSIIVIITIVIYSFTGKWGELAQYNRFYGVICALAWTWILVGQFLFIFLILEKEIDNE